MNVKVWRHSRWDAVLFSIAVAQFGATLAWAFAFQSLPLIWNLCILLALSLLFYFNPIVIVHNFLHCPFFASTPINRLFAALNSINLCLPQVLYKHHHYIHHRFSNDPVENGTTRDASSSFRYGKNGKQEHWASYSAFSLFRDATSRAYEETVARGDRGQLVLESAFVVAGVALWIAIDWRFFLLGYLPLFYIGWFLAHMENYFEHHHATDPRNKFANSVSFYPRWYNRFMFNEGYHQEHHLEPGRHWSQRPAVREKYREQLAAAGAYQARFPPLLGFLD